MRYAGAMGVDFERIEQADATVVDWIASDTWPYHLNVRPSRAEVASWIAAGSFVGDGVASFWVQLAGERVGILRLFDLDDLTPLFDLRIGSDHRGEGLGTATLRFGTQHVFDTRPNAQRFGGYTRHDNHAMRAVFENLGFTHEARHREAWRTAEGDFVDSVGYAVLRREWYEQASRAEALLKLTPGGVGRR